jgi:putative acetyltransferase
VGLTEARSAWREALARWRDVDFASERGWVDPDEVDAKKRILDRAIEVYGGLLTDLRADPQAFETYVRGLMQPGEPLAKWRRKRNMLHGLWWEQSCRNGPDFVPSVRVRRETSKDHETVDALVEAAFGQEAEARLVRALRGEAGTISLVAETDEGVVGHTLLSPVHAPMRACALAPVAVHPDHQRKSAGAALVEAALREAWTDHRACFVLGSPRYYGAWFQQAAPRWTCPWPADVTAFQVAFANAHEAAHYRDGPVTYALAFAAV